MQGMEATGYWGQKNVGGEKPYGPSAWHKKEMAPNQGPLLIAWSAAVTGQVITQARFLDSLPVSVFTCCSHLLSDNADTKLDI